MEQPYKVPQAFSDGRFCFRPLEDADVSPLLAVYGDERAVPFFNGDNCNGDDFHYTTPERMKQAVEMWKYCRELGAFLRLVAEVDGTVCGTCEVFLRDTPDDLNGAIILRLDVGSAWENADALTGLLRLLLPQLHPLLGGRMVLTKDFPGARHAVLQALGFVPGPSLVGGDGRVYPGYVMRPASGLMPLGEEHRDEIAALAKQHPAEGAVLLRDLTACGLASDALSVFALPNQAGAWDALVSRSGAAYGLLALRKGVDLAPVAAFLRGRQVDALSGSVETLRALLPLLPA